MQRTPVAVFSVVREYLRLLEDRFGARLLALRLFGSYARTAARTPRGNRQTFRGLADYDSRDRLSAERAVEEVASARLFVEEARKSTPGPHP